MSLSRGVTIALRTDMSRPRRRRGRHVIDPQARRRNESGTKDSRRCRRGRAVGGCCRVREQHRRRNQRESSAAVQAHRGGTLKLLAKSAGGTIDPQVNYTLQYWQLYQATYDGLLAFTKAGGNAAFDVVPDIATSCRRRRTAARPGSSRSARGSSSRTARTVTPADVVASFQRIFKVKSPTSGSVLRRHRRREGLPRRSRRPAR